MFDMVCLQALQTQGADAAKSGSLLMPEPTVGTCSFTRVFAPTTRKAGTQVVMVCVRGAERGRLQSQRSSRFVSGTGCALA